MTTLTSICFHGTHLDQSTGPIRKKKFLNPKGLTIKKYHNWPRGFRGEAIWKCEFMLPWTKVTCHPRKFTLMSIHVFLVNEVAVQGMIHHPPLVLKTLLKSLKFPVSRFWRKRFPKWFYMGTTAILFSQLVSVD